MSDTNKSYSDENEQKNSKHENGEAKDKTPMASSSGDPGRTPGAAEGDEETIDEDIREKEQEGKL